MKLLLRGYLKKDNYQPKSNRKSLGSYDIDFLEYSHFYKQMIYKLTQTYGKVDLYFSTYDTTPKKYLNKIKKEFNPKDIFLCSEVQSSQFSTVCEALHKTPFTDAGKDELIMLFRSDILMSDLLIEQLRKFKFGRKNLLYTLCRDKDQQGKLANQMDIFHAFYPLILTEVRNWMCQGNASAHGIEKIFGVEPIFDINKYNWLDTKEGYDDYINKGLIKDLFSTWHGVENTYFGHEKYADFRLKHIHKSK